MMKSLLLAALLAAGTEARASMRVKKFVSYLRYHYDHDDDYTHAL
jgi:hypothetical protein